jgi:hypothetical protein
MTENLICIPKRFNHWTLRYVIDRVKVMWYKYKYPDLPWLTKMSIEILNSWLSKEDKGLEWGSGKSTLWLSRRVKHLTSVENNMVWYKKISNMIKETELDNVTYLYESSQNSDGNNYINVVNSFVPNSLDFILVDGELREYCALASLKILKPCGILILDNANWYLPSKSRSPSSRDEVQGAQSVVWDEFLQKVENWRCIWTTSGVTDTAIFFKPHL